MGPRLCRRGDQVCNNAVHTRVGLQWGHAFAGVETGLSPLRVAQESAASMGPRLCRRGDPPSAWCCCARGLLQWGHAFAGVETSACAEAQRSRIGASMGPRLCRRGDLPASNPHPARESASMGPRLCRRGDVLSQMPGFSACSRFNGATPLQAWRRVTPRRVQLPRIGLQWGHAFAGVETSSRQAASRPRCRLQWGHAFAGVETDREGLSVDHEVSFNGATPLQAWRLPADLHHLLAPTMLQWGHAFAGVETAYHFEIVVSCPRLQWGHAFAGVETHQGMARGWRDSCFNGATPLQAWRPSRVEVWRRKSFSFNGATPLQAWRPLQHAHLVYPRKHASMGPRLCRRGDRPRDERQSASRHASMGPRLCRRGDLVR